MACPDATAFALFIAQVREAYASYQFYRVYQAAQKFCVTDLSSFYLDVTKDRMYIRATDAPERRASQTTLYHILQARGGRWAFPNL